MLFFFKFVFYLDTHIDNSLLWVNYASIKLLRKLKFISLKGRVTKGKSEGKSVFIPGLTPQMAVTVRAGPGQSLEAGTPPRSPTPVAETQATFHYFATPRSKGAILEMGQPECEPGLQYGMLACQTVA